MRRKALTLLLTMLMPLTIWAQTTDITNLSDIANMAGNYRPAADVSGATGAIAGTGNTSAFLEDHTNIFGGGKGATAIVTGNPQVTLSGNAKVTGNVYGGGDAAQVSGQTNVILRD